MSISTTTRKAGPYPCNGSTVAFPFSYKVFQTSDVLVVRADSLGNETPLALGTDYSVTLNPNQDTAPGGTVTLNVAPASGYTVTLGSQVLMMQPMVLTNSGGFYPTVLNDSADRQVIISQQLSEEVDRTLKLAVSTPAGVVTTLPAPTANSVIGWNAAADELQNVPLTTLATVVAFGTAVPDLFNGDGSTVDFYLSANPGALGNLDVAVGGITQRPGIDFTWSSGTKLTFTSAPPAGTNNVYVRYIQALPQGYSDAELVSYGSETVETALDARPPEIGTYTALRAYTGTATAFYVRGVANIFDGGHGTFRVHASDTTTADDGCTVLVDLLGRRWKRDFSGSLRLDWAEGVTKDGVTDNTAAFNAIGSVASSRTIKCVDVSPGAYAIAGTVIRPAGVVFSGPESSLPNASADYAVRIVHTSTTPGTDIFQSASVGATTYQSSPSLRNMSITGAGANTRYGVLDINCIGGRSHNVQFAGGFAGACVAFKGALNCRYDDFRFINSSAVENPAAVLALSYNGELYSTTVTFKDSYTSGKIAPGAGGFASVFVAQAAAGKEIVFDGCLYESINGKAFDIYKGNQVIVKAPYCENVPNSDSTIPMFEIGVTGASAPNNAFDSLTSLTIDGQGGELMQYSQGAATLTRLINSDVAQYVEIFDILLTRVIKLISGTNNTQRFKFRDVKGSGVTTIQSGLTSVKIHDDGGNFFNTTNLAASARMLTDAERDAGGAQYMNTDIAIASDAGTEGSPRWFDKANNRWVTFRIKSGVAPTLRTWIRGDVVDNAFPSIGGPTGWSCTASGTGGAATWQICGQSGAAKGNTAGRPTKTTFQVATDAAWAGAMYFDTTLAAAGKPIWWNGTNWVDATGTVV